MGRDWGYHNLLGHSDWPRDRNLAHDGRKVVGWNRKKEGGSMGAPSMGMEIDEGVWCRYF